MKIAWFCIPAHGHTNPSLGIVKELLPTAVRISESFHACGGAKEAREFLEGIKGVK